MANTSGFIFISKKIPVLTVKNKVMKEALKIIFLFKKPTWDDSRFVYIFFGIVGWLEVISILVGLIK